MKNWYEILQEVKEAKGKAKQVVLEENKDNQLLKDILYFLYSPRVVTGISKKKLDKVNILRSFEPMSIEQRVRYAMDYLSENNSGRDVDVSMALGLIESSEDQLEKDMLRSLIIKDTPFGISSSTINKVFKDLIPQHKVQKSILWDGEDLPERAVVMTKLDGNNCTLINEGKKAIALSRSGAEMKGLDHILKYAQEKLPTGRVYFGELVLKNYDHLPHDEQFRIGNGITNSKKEQKPELTLVVFDTVTLKEFKDGKSDTPFEYRLDVIRKYIHKQYNWNDTYFNDVERVPIHTYTTDKVLITNTFNDITSIDHQEGLMLVGLNSPWQAKKVKYSQKVKPNLTVDVYVTGLKEHIRGGKVGALEVDYKGNPLYVPGIIDTLRDRWWNNPDEIIGRLIEVEAMGISKDKTGKESLRHPRFVRIRTDKDEVSYD